MTSALYFPLGSAQGPHPGGAQNFEYRLLILLDLVHQCDRMVATLLPVKPLCDLQSAAIERVSHDVIPVLPMPIRERVKILRQSLQLK